MQPNEPQAPQTSPDVPPMSPTPPTDPNQNVNPVPAPSAPASAPAPTPKKGLPKALKIILGIFVGFIVLAGIGIAALVFFVNLAAQAPVDVSNKFVDAMQANNPTDAYALTSESFKKSIPETQLTSIITRVSPLLTGEETISGKKIESKNGVNQAAITYTVENDGKTRHIRIILLETDSKWEVINLKTSDSPLEAIIE